jgi:hypothetical protein
VPSRRIAACLLSVTLLSCGSGAPAGGGPAALTAVAPLSSPRATHAIVRTARHVLLIGGCVRDGCEPGPGSATVDVIGASSDTRRLGRLAAPRVQPGAVWLGGERALVVGGWVGGRVDASTEVFDAVAGASRAGPAMRHPRSAAALARLADGRVLIAGGWDGRRPLAAAEVFDPATGRLAPVGSLRQARSGATATLLRDGRVLVAGGGTGDGADRVALATAELFDPSTGRFAPTGRLLLRRYKHGAVALADGSVLVVGGSDERDYAGKTATVERYDPATGRFRPAGRLAEARFKLADASVLLPSGKVLVAGGFARPELFDPATGTSRLLPVELGARWNYLTATRAGGDVLLAGGYREGSIEVTNRVWRLAL